jgi:hypothetical protein
MCFTEGMTNDNLMNQNYKKLCFDKIKIVPIMILFLVLKNCEFIVSAIILLIFETNERLGQQIWDVQIDTYSSELNLVN